MQQQLLIAAALCQTDTISYNESMGLRGSHGQTRINQSQDNIDVEAFRKLSDFDRH